MISVTPLAPAAAPTDMVRQVEALLQEVDEEFVPPLSARLDTMGLGEAPPPAGRGLHATWWR